jgi:hypothetical protein
VAAVTSIIIVKSMPYRDTPLEEFSNRYYLKDPPPQTAAEWEAAFSEIRTHERLIYSDDVNFEKAYGYNDDALNAQSVHNIDWRAAGDLLQGTLANPSIHMAGDQAACMEWKTSRKNSRGKWVYLRKYVHHGYVSPTAPDSLDVAYRTALNGFANDFAAGVAGTWGGLRSRRFVETFISQGTLGFVTTRTLKRRGKRPLATTLTTPA